MLCPRSCPCTAAVKDDAADTTVVVTVGLDWAMRIGKMGLLGVLEVELASALALAFEEEAGVEDGLEPLDAVLERRRWWRRRRSRKGIWIVDSGAWSPLDFPVFVIKASVGSEREGLNA
jgi:hypothetical protein